MSYPIETIRSQFPILQQSVYGKPLVYLDNGATAQKPQQVIDTVSRIYQTQNANIHRGVHHLSNVCTDLYENARRTVAQHIGAAQAEEVVFVRNTTEAINLVAYAYGNKFIGAGDEVVVSVMEHHSNIVPWQLLCGRTGATLRVVDMDDEGNLRMDQMESLIGPKTKMVCCTQVSNVLGTVNDVRHIASLAHAVGAVMLVDAAQSLPHMPIDVQDLGCDFMVFSGHKVYAPLGSGALYGRIDLLRQMDPWMGGGEMIDKVSFRGTTFAEPPLRFEAGTPDYVAAAGLAAALEYVDGIGMEAIEAHENALVTKTIEGLKTIGGVRIVGEARKHSGAVSFLVGNIHPYDAGMILDKMGIAVRTGHHCAQPLMERLGISGTVRASFGVYTSEADIDKLLNGVEFVKKMFA